jgi:hypothetical protein
MELAYLWPSFNNGYSLYDLLTPAQLELSQQMVAATFGAEHQCSFWNAG